MRTHQVRGVISPLGGKRGRSLRAALTLACALTLVGCTAAQTPLTTQAPPSEPQAGTPPPAAVVIDEGDAERGPKTELFTADDRQSLPAMRPRTTAGGAGDVTLDFADADLKDVVRTVLGDVLKVPFLIDPQIQGKVTLKTSAPLRKEDVIAALETALKVNGAVIVRADNVYNVVPAAEAQKRIDGFDLAGTAAARQPGYGVEIVPLRFIAAIEMKKILEPVSPAGGILSTDATRNFLFIAGTGQERATMLDTIRLFDVDYMRGMSYALVRPDHVDAPALAQELGRVFASTRGPSASLIRFVPLTRLNTLLIVSPRAALLKDVTRWVARLDVPPTGPGRRIYYYRLQNAKAEDVARALASVYGTAVDLSAVSEDGRNDTGPTDTTGTPPDGLASTQGASEPNVAGNPAISGLRLPDNTLRGSTAGGPHIAIDQSNNALIIRAEGSEYASLARFLKEIDVAPDQVLIEVTIAEVSLNDTLKYGVEWFFKNNGEKFKLSKTGTVSSVFPGFAFTYVVPDVDVALSALGTITNLRVISSPKLLTLNNKPAYFQVGDQVPIITQTATGVQNATDLTVVNSVQLRDTGLLLKVTPRIGKSGMVFVDVRQEVSNAVETTTSTINSPTIQQRKLSSTVAVHDGDSVALGGLIKDSNSSGDSGVPYLKDLPVLGKLFGTTNVTGDRTELLIFLRPRIIRDPAAAREMTDQLRNGLQGLDDLMGAVGETRTTGRFKPMH